jgi:hypothetical protein
MIGTSATPPPLVTPVSPGMTSRTALDHLRDRLWLPALPDTISVPTGPGAGAVVTKPVTEATVDDIALAANALAREAAALHRKADALRQVHDLARSAGALGTANADVAAARSVGLGAKPLQDGDAAASCHGMPA